MADEKYSIDDILAEIDSKRETAPHEGGYNGSITDIIGGDELDEVIRSAHKRHEEEPFAARQLSEEEENERRSAEIAAANERSKRRKSKEAKEAREAESRLAASEKAKHAQAKEEAARARREEKDRRRAETFSARDEQAQREQAQREYAQREAAERRGQSERSARLAGSAGAQRTDEEVSVRRSAEISAAAEKIKHAADELMGETEHSGFTAELSSPEDASRLFGGEEETEGEYVQPTDEHVQPYVKPKVSGADEDIVFHTRSDLVTTETMELRKQHRIEQIQQALLSVDSEAESPDDLLDSLNPMDSREKAAESLKAVSAEELGDTLTVAGNDLKKIAGGETEHVREYSPVTSRRRMEIERRADDILFSPAAAKQISGGKYKGNDSFVDSLKKEKAKSSSDGGRTVVFDDLSASRKAPSEPLNIDEKKLIDTSVIASDTAEVKTGSDDPVEAVRRADELAQKKKRKLSGFILENIEEEVAEAPKKAEDTDDDDTEEEIDLDDEAVIGDHLSRSSKGLMSRLFILVLLLLAALFIGITNQFGVDMGGITDFFSKMSHPNYYLYAYLVIGILSFTACSSVVTNGLSRLVRLRPDGDTLCALAHITAIVSLIPYLSETEYIQRGRAHIYIIVSLTALCFNTVSKLCIVRAAQRNFRFIAGDRTKYFVQRFDGESAEQLTKGAVSGIPAVASMRKTEFLCDFIISTYCEDISDRISRVMTPITFAAAIFGGFSAYLMGESTYVMNNISWAATVASAVFSLGASFSGSLAVTLPLLSASRRLASKNASVLGYSAVEDFSETNAVLVEAKALFPANSVKINNIWDYNKHRKSSSPKIPIDEAIIYAASLAVTSESVLADAFFNMLNYKKQLLKPVSNCVYESNLGVMGWIDHRRVLLGNREHMKSHEITVPDMKKESSANKNGDEVIYLAVGGEVCMLFFVELSANPVVKENVRRLAVGGVSLVVKTVDGMITDAALAELFDIGAEQVRIIPFEQHDAFGECTKFVPKGSAAVSCDGTFTSFAAAINAAKSLRGTIAFGCIIQTAGTALGMLLALILALFAKFPMFNCFYVLLYNLGWALLTAVVQAIKRKKI